MGEEYYKLLQVDRSATDHDLKKSHRKLVMKWHPDKNHVNKEEAEAKFKEISNAYKVLSDPKQRAVYNKHGEEGLKYYHYQDGEGGLGYYFGKGIEEGSGIVMQKCAAVEFPLPCSLEDLYTRTVMTMKFSREVIDVSGRPTKVEESLKVEIKPGWKEGTKITFPEMGSEKRGYIPADIVFVIAEKPHSIFQRDGNDLVVTKEEISLVEALTGYTVTLRTLDDRNVTITTSDVISPINKEVVVEGEGMPFHREPHRKGNLRIKFENIKFPTRLTFDQKMGIKRLLG